MTIQKFNIEITDFKGPMDLLLHLIKKSKMNILDLSISDITNQYIAFIEKQTTNKINIASEYLVIATKLLSLKSQELLPKHDFLGNEEVVDDYEESKNDLVKNLLVYKTFKNVFEEFKIMNENDQHSFSREKYSLSEYYEVEKSVAKNIEIKELNKALIAVLNNSTHSTTKVIKQQKYKIADGFDNIKSFFANKMLGFKCQFADLFLTGTSKEEIIINFFVILDLVKQQKLSVYQENSSSQIMIEYIKEM